MRPISSQPSSVFAANIKDSVLQNLLTESSNPSLVAINIKLSQLGYSKLNLAKNDAAGQQDTTAKLLLYYLE